MLVASVMKVGSCHVLLVALVAINVGSRSGRRSSLIGQAQTPNRQPADEQDDARQARAIADELRGRAGAAIELVEGKLGQLDVYVDAELVATRGDGMVGRMLSRAPDVAAMIAGIERRVAVADGDACKLPDAREP
jgi:hypothetical protein